MLHWRVPRQRHPLRLHPRGSWGGEPLTEEAAPRQSQLGHTGLEVLDLEVDAPSDSRYHFSPSFHRPYTRSERVGAVKLLVFDLSTMVLSVPLWEAAAFGVELTLQEDGSQAYGGSDLALRPGTEGVAVGQKCLVGSQVG